MFDLNRWQSPLAYEIMTSDLAQLGGSFNHSQFSSFFVIKGQQNVQIQEMRAELDEMSATHNRMESIVFNLVDDMRDLKGTSRLQYKQFQTVSAELNHKTDKIRHENKKVLDRIRACQVRETNILIILCLLIYIYIYIYLL